MNKPKTKSTPASEVVIDESMCKMIPAHAVVIDGVVRQPCPVPEWVLEMPDEMPGGYKADVVSDEVMIGQMGKKQVRKPKAAAPPAKADVDSPALTSVEILAEMVASAKTKREIRQIANLAYSMARTNRRFTAVSQLADQKLCDLYGVR